MPGGLSASNIPATASLHKNAADPADLSIHQQPHPTGKLQKPSPPEASSSNQETSKTTQQSISSQPTEPPQRAISIRPDISPAEIPMTATEVENLCKVICNRTWKTDLGYMFDKVVAADRRGRIDDKLYPQLLDFLFCFVPMVVLTPR
jgi:hypothetical protein